MIETEDLAEQLGVRFTVLDMALQRMVRFRVAYVRGVDHDTARIGVRRWLPDVPIGHQSRWSEPLRVEHAEHAEIVGAD